VVPAVTGFLKSISLGFKSEHISRYLFQDLLRVLKLIFDYADKNTKVAEIFEESYALIDSRAWIEVVPQIIARISTDKIYLKRLLQELLIKISREHPQALIYPLTIACQAKSFSRKNTALRILDEITKIQPKLVEQASLVS
jgi:FKBP12-rapamycin complex-associated protein